MKFWNELSRASPNRAYGSRKSHRTSKASRAIGSRASRAIGSRKSHQTSRASIILIFSPLLCSVGARKALRALKGLVRLQAIIRGRAVRRQAIATLKCLQSMVSFQSQVSAKKLQMVEGTWNTFHENKVLQGFNFNDNLIKKAQYLNLQIDSNSQRRWDDSILSKDEANGMFLSKREAAIKRERIKEYSLSQRVHGIRTQQGQWKMEILKQYYKEELDPPISAPKRSFVHKKQLSVGEDNDFASSPAVPTYMAATESAKAKARSMSSPRLRGVNLDACSDTNSPYKHKLPPISSVNLGGF
ncbi:hypothetical protein HYC85_010466 [Camellia sinensis]|uniref:DUF4005 domain-containing protein n=1 Tax=Camellia sinensis TaxID=4442 RepID=A0A7J7HHY4_CAMSI|nr:hypothetical protein HYC85_010466 [Camellia sinensis]